MCLESQKRDRCICSDVGMPYEEKWRTRCCSLRRGNKRRRRRKDTKKGERYSSKLEVKHARAKACKLICMATLCTMYLRSITFFLGEVLTPPRGRLCPGIETPVAAILIARTLHLQRQRKNGLRGAMTVVDRYNGRTTSTSKLFRFQSSRGTTPCSPARRHLLANLDKSCRLEWICSRTPNFSQPK